MEYVDAIFEGRIVRVREDLAKREGLVILRKAEQKVVEAPRKIRKEEEKFVGFDDFRKPLNWRKNQVAAELIDNFHWNLVKARKSKNLTRKQVAQSLNVSENDIKLIENGVLPSNDFVLINKLQDYYHVNLRKDGKNYSDSKRIIPEKRDNKPASSNGNNMSGSDLEFFE